MARSLLALCMAAGPLLASGEARDLLQKAPARGLTESATCPNGVEPLLWKAEKGGSTVYVIGSGHILLADIEPVPDQVIQALGCADMAYFNLACGKADLGHYLSHCKQYKITESEDSIAARIPAQDLAQLQSGLQQLAAGAPPECPNAAATLSTLVAGVNQTTSHITLRALFQEALDAINPTVCTLSTGAESYEDSLRATFGNTRPTFGLEDISVPCNLFQGATVEQDVDLARKMSEHFLQGTWVSQVVQQQKAMSEVMKCGDLHSLTMMQDLPWLNVAQAVEQNPTLLTNIEQAQGKYPGKTLVVAVNVAHLVNATSSSLTQLMTQAGFTMQRVTATTTLTCTASTYTAAGAKELGECLMPPDKAQPASCNAFMSQIKATVGPKPGMYGRSKSSTTCNGCVNATTTCACEFDWTNTTAFEDLCQNTDVDGVSGNVYDMDLTRNPGSQRLGPQYVEKTVRSLFQNCYATSCDIGLLQEMALRNWYKSDASLTDGIVTLHGPGAPADGPLSIGSMDLGVLSTKVKSPLGGTWPLWEWILLALGVVGLIMIFVACFLTEKSRGGGKQKRSRGVGQLEDATGQPMMGQGPYGQAGGSFGRDNYQQPPTQFQAQAGYPPRHGSPNRGQPPFPTQQVYDPHAAHMQQMQMQSMQQMPMQGGMVPGTQGMGMPTMQGQHYAANMNTHVFGGQGQYAPMSTMGGGMPGYGGYGGMGH